MNKYSEIAVKHKKYPGKSQPGMNIYAEK